MNSAEKNKMKQKTKKDIRTRYKLDLIIKMYYLQLDFDKRTHSNIELSITQVHKICTEKIKLVQRSMRSP